MGKSPTLHTALKMVSLTESLMREYLAADKNKDGFVDRTALEQYHMKMGHNKKDIQEWMARFDANKDGQISMPEFARALGVRMEEMKEVQGHILDDEAGNGAQLPEDINILATTMPTYSQKLIIDEFKKLVDDKVELNMIASKLREFLEAKFRPTWQVVALEGSYAMNFVHEPFNSFQCKYLDKILLAWRTPKS